MYIPFVLVVFAVHLQNSLQLPKLPVPRNRFTVIAHRGDHEFAPENTLAAYQQAIDRGADYIETDLRTTKDGALVIMHDNTVNRTTNGTGKVNELSFENFRALKIDGRHQAPTFREVLLLCKDRIHIYLDFKDADVKAAFETIKACGMEQQVLVYINKTQQYTDWRAIAPHIPLMVSLPEHIKDVAALDAFLNQHTVSALDGDFRQYTPAMVVAAARRGVAVWPDVQRPGEGPALWKEAIDLGLQGFQSDRPAALVKYLHETGRR